MSKCKEGTKFRYTWPGQDEAVCCQKHAEQIRVVANAIGLHLQIIELSENDLGVGLECSSYE